MEPLWTPSSARVATARVTAFRERVADARGLELPDYESLRAWSVAEPEAFWAEVWERLGVRAEHRGERALEHPDRFPGARWFPDARLNFAENLLEGADPNQEAIVFRGEREERRALTFHDLRHQVALAQAGLEQLGVAAGDRVAAFIPNIPEAVTAMLAATSLGATWSSCSPDFGFQGVLDRFGQIQPKVLFAADGYLYGGKSFDCTPKLARLLEAIPSIEKVILVPFLDPMAMSGGLPRTEPWGALLGRGIRDVPRYPALPFDHPLYVMYSSGTTGLPKCIVHGAGGTLLQHLKEHALHCDLSPGDRLFYFTTCGWMMWNWLVSGLATGATVHLYDGSPFHPGPEAMWDHCAADGWKVFGTSARFLAASEKAGQKPRETHDLAPLRSLLSTGSPLAPGSFDYVYRDVKEDVLLGSISGGTDILSCFALASPVLPVYRGELQTRGLGMDVRVFDDAGQELVDETGELVCLAPFPSCPVGFWDDEDGRRFHDAYFDVFEGVWRHGDWVELTSRGGMVIYGRSDAVLNPGGVRIGTAEIYRVVERLDDVLEALVVGQETGDDVRVVLFLRLREGLTLDDELGARVRKEIRAGASPRHVPAVVCQVPDIPRTLSGKIVELAVRNVIHGRPVTNRDALRNPEALEHFRDRPELAR